jgi:hypothetical protein
MDLLRFKHVLEILKGLGAAECGIETDEENRTVVRAISGDGNCIGVYCDIEHLGHPYNAGIGIQSIAGVLSRVDLFSDLEKVKVDFGIRDDFVYSIGLKHGRRKAEIRTTSVTSCSVPVKIPEFDPAISLELTQEFVQHLHKAHQSVKNSLSDNDCTLTLRGSNGEDFEIEIQKGKHDTVVEPVQVTFTNNPYTGETVFPSESFMRVLKQASMWSEDKSAIVQIDCEGHATVQVGELSVIVISDYHSLEEEEIYA